MMPKCVDCACGICEGGGFPPARINHDTETRELEPTLPWGLKQLEIIHTSSTSRDASPYRPHVVPLPFPLLGLCLKMVPLLSPTGIYNTPKVRSVRHVCDEFAENTKNDTGNRVQVKRRKLVPRPNSTPCFWFRPLGNIANVFDKVITKGNT